MKDKAAHFHFISGMSRSGPTLLSGILKQNPDFHAGMSSPVSSLINGVLEQIGAGSEFYTFFDEDKRKRACSAIFDSYYQEEQNKKVIFDTNRMWSARPHQLTELFDEFDASLGAKGLHTVQRKVEFKPRRTILPPDLFQKYSEMAFWQDTAGSGANVIAPKKKSTNQGQTST